MDLLTDDFFRTCHLKGGNHCATFRQFDRGIIVNVAVCDQITPIWKCFRCYCICKKEAEGWVRTYSVKSPVSMFHPCLTYSRLVIGIDTNLVAECFACWNDQKFTLQKLEMKKLTCLCEGRASKLALASHFSSHEQFTIRSSGNSKTSTIVFHTWSNSINHLDSISGVWSQ